MDILTFWASGILSDQYNVISHIKSLQNDVPRAEQASDQILCGSMIFPLGKWDVLVSNVRTGLKFTRFALLNA